MPTPPAVCIQQLSHFYGSRQALAGVSFDVAAGEIFGLLGPNGGGKTTLFRILSTMLVPSGGRAQVLGCDSATQAAEVRRRIGVVFQSPSLDPKLTVRENLVHQGHLYGLRGRMLDDRIDESLRRLGLAERSSDRVEKLSGGLARRAELAKGLLHQPSVLLLDEPSTGLDPGARREVWDYLCALRERVGVTVLLTTHLMHEAEGCDRVAILDRGNLVAVDTPRSLCEQVGGEVIAIESVDPEELCRQIGERFDVQPATVDGTVRIQRRDGHRFIAELIEALPGLIDAITLSKPTLEDVFIQRTGHRFWDQESQRAAS